MAFAKNSQEAKDFMKRVREAKAKKPTPSRAPQKDAQPDESSLIDLPQNKFQLLLNLIMSIQDDIDFLLSKHYS